MGCVSIWGYWRFVVDADGTIRQMHAASYSKASSSIVALLDPKKLNINFMEQIDTHM